MTRIVSKPKFCAWYDNNEIRPPWMVRQYITSINSVAASLEEISTDFQIKDVFTEGWSIPTSIHTPIIDLMGAHDTMTSTGLRANQVGKFAMCLNSYSFFRDFIEVPATQPYPLLRC